MADIFLSYNEKDRPRVRQLAQALERAGWSVWWDRRVPAGLTWRSLLEQELQNMRCMLVLWSTNSVKSDWVCEEATEGRLLGRLIPVFIEKVRAPAGFREVQAADLVGWDGSANFLGLQQLLADITHMLGTPTQHVNPIPGHPDPPKPKPDRWHWAGAAALVLAVGYGGWKVWPPAPPHATVTEPPALTVAPQPTLAAAPSAAAPASAVAPIKPAHKISRQDLATLAEPLKSTANPTPEPPVAVNLASVRCRSLWQERLMAASLGESPSSKLLQAIQQECPP